MSDSQRRAQFMKSGPSNKRGFDLISDALPFGRLWYGEPNAISNTTGYAKFYSRSHDAVIRVFDESGATGRSKSIFLRFILMVNRTCETGSQCERNLESPIENPIARVAKLEDATDLGFQNRRFHDVSFVSKNKRFTTGKCSFRFEGEPLRRTSRNIVILAQNLAQWRTRLRYIWIARFVI